MGRRGVGARDGAASAFGVRPAGAVETARLTIRRLSEADRAEFVRAIGRSREHLARFMPLHIPGEDDAGVFARQLRQAAAGDATGRDWRRVLFDREGRLVGAVNVNDIRRGLENRGELTVWVAADESGKGYAREALSALITVAFAPEPTFASVRSAGSGLPIAVASGALEDAARGSAAGAGVGHGLGLDRLTALVSRDNAACLRLLARLGFNRTEHALPLELTIGDRRVPHDEWRLWARVSMLEAKPLGAFPARVGESIRRIEQVERSAEHRRF